MYHMLALPRCQRCGRGCQRNCLWQNAAAPLLAGALQYRTVVTASLARSDEAVLCLSACVLVSTGGLQPNLLAGAAHI
jgi:hypothetical protein